MSKKHTKNGAVKVVLFSDEKIALVRDNDHVDPRWSLPGGSIEDGESVINAAIREVREETGILLLESDLKHMLHEIKVGREYLPHICVACIDHDRLASYSAVGHENDRTLEVQLFDRGDVCFMNDIIDEHLPVIQEYASPLIACKPAIP